jgi:hypothetical protein
MSECCIKLLLLLLIILPSPFISPSPGCFVPALMQSAERHLLQASFPCRWTLPLISRSQASRRERERGKSPCMHSSATRDGGGFVFGYKTKGEQEERVQRKPPGRVRISGLLVVFLFPWLRASRIQDHV